MKLLKLNCLAVVFAAHAATASAQQIEWIRTLGAPDVQDYVSEIAADSLGNVFVCGNTGALFPGASSDASSAFVAKYSSSGDMLWAHHFSKSELVAPLNLSADGLGNVYVAGSTEANLGNTNDGYDAFLAKFDAAGNRLWARQLGSNVSDQINGVSVDPFGNVFVSGSTQGQLAAPVAGYIDAFVAKYDDSGTMQWVRQFGTEQWDIAFDVATDGAGNAFVTGETYGTLPGSGQPQADWEWENAFVVKFDPAGNQLWARQSGSPGQEQSFDNAADAFGNVFFSGRMTGVGDSLTAATVGKYDADGNLEWLRHPETTAIADFGDGLETDGRGNVYAGSYSRGFAGLPDPASFDVFVTKYDTAGDVIWKSIIGTRGDGMVGVAFDGINSVYATGYTSNNSNGPYSADIFIIKIVDNTIPEPTTLALLGFGLLAIPARRSRLAS